MAFKTLQIHVNTHAKLKELSEQRNKQGEPNYSMSAILKELVNKQHKKECK